MTLTQAAWIHPRFLALYGVEELQTWLERDTRAAPREGLFHVRVRSRIVFSGPFTAALARYQHARDAQLWRRLSGLPRRRSAPVIRRLRQDRLPNPLNGRRSSTNSPLQRCMRRRPGGRSMALRSDSRPCGIQRERRRGRRPSVD
jgi:hypothetical protein